MVGVNFNNILLTKSAVSSFLHLRTLQLSKFPFNRRRIKLRKHGLKVVVLLVVVSLVYLQLTIGILQKFLLERDFAAEFTYPQDISNFQDVVKRYADRKGASGGGHYATPGNTNYSTITFLTAVEGISTNQSVGLLLVVKSATNNYQKRMAIRKTWGKADYLRDNVLSPELPTKVVFISGISKDHRNVSGLFSAEEQNYGDIVIAQFYDSYENNTYKTVLAMRWSVEHVKSFKYLMIVDDDMYINLVNTIMFLKNLPNTRVQAVTSIDSGVTAFYQAKQIKEVCPWKTNITLADKPLIMGNLIVDARPFRSIVGFGSKWSMSMEDYQFNYFPPYIAGGATLIDSKTVKLLYYGSFFTKHFWIDDVFIGIIAHKLGIILTNNDLMDSSYKLHYNPNLLINFHDMIAQHGIECPEQLIDLWHSRDVKALKDCRYFATATK